MATVNSQPLLLQTLPAEIVAMVAEQLQKPGLCRFRATMNSELVNKTLHFFAKQTFSELNWQSKLMSQSALEELEEIADRPAFLPYVTALDFDLCYLHELKYWAHSIMHLAETKSTVQETARIRDSASQLSLFARDEEAFWQKPESWTRLSQLFSKFRALNQITTNASYGQQSNESGSVCHHPDVRRLQERYQISPEAWMPGTHIFHSHCCMEDISFRLLIAIARSGLQLKHMGTSVVEIHNVTFLNGLVRFEWLEPGKASKASKRASALNQWFSFMPNLRDLKLTGTGIDDWSRDYNLNLSEIRWPMSLMKLHLKHMSIFLPQLGSFGNLPTAMASVHLEYIRMCEDFDPGMEVAWFKELERYLQPRTLELIFEAFCLGDAGDYFRFPKLRADKIVPGTHEMSTIGWGEKFCGTDMAGYFQNLQDRLRR